MHIRVLLSKYRSYTPCGTCAGARLKTDSLLWRIILVCTAQTEVYGVLRGKSLVIHVYTEGCAQAGRLQHDIAALIANGDRLAAAVEHLNGAELNLGGINVVGRKYCAAHRTKPTVGTVTRQLWRLAAKTLPPDGKPVPLVEDGQYMPTARYPQPLRGPRIRRPDCAIKGTCNTRRAKTNQPKHCIMEPDQQTVYCCMRTIWRFTYKW